MPCCEWKLATCLTCRIAVSAYTHKYGMILAHRLVALGADLFGLPVSAVKASPAPLVLWQLFGSWRYWNDRKLRKFHFHSFSDAQWKFWLGNPPLCPWSYHLKCEFFHEPPTRFCFFPLIYHVVVAQDRSINSRGIHHPIKYSHRPSFSHSAAGIVGADLVKSVHPSFCLVVIHNYFRLSLFMNISLSMT